MTTTESEAVMGDRPVVDEETLEALILLCQCGEVFEEDGVEASG